MGDITERYMDYWITKVNFFNISDIFSLHHFFIQLTHKIFIEYLSCASNCPKHLKYTSEQNKAHITPLQSSHWGRRGLDKVLDNKYIQWW